MGTVKRFIRFFFNKWPGNKYLGKYRFLPIFFVLGAALEFTMINWHVGEVNFYKVFKRRQAENIVDSMLHSERQQ